MAAEANLTVLPVNDDPTCSGPASLGEMDEDGCFVITKDKLLANASDVDGDELHILNLRLSKGSGALTQRADGNWIFKPEKDWNGDVEFSYDISDQPGHTSSNCGNSEAEPADAPSRHQVKGAYFAQRYWGYGNPYIFQETLASLDLKGETEYSVGLSASGEWLDQNTGDVNVTRVLTSAGEELELIDGRFTSEEEGQYKLNTCFPP